MFLKSLLSICKIIMVLEHDTILHHNPLLSVDSVINELLAEEMRLESQVDKGGVENEIFPSLNPFVFAVPH